MCLYDLISLLNFVKNRIYLKLCSIKNGAVLAWTSIKSQILVFSQLIKF